MRLIDRLPLALLAATFIWNFSCTERETSRPIVVVSVLPQAYFVERIAGDLVDVVVMIPPGASEEAYEPTISQLRAASDAKLYVKVGHPSFPFEKAWLDRIVGRKTRVVNGSEGIVEREGDPHVWVSPDCARTMSRNIEQALVELLPSERGRLESNATALIADVDALDAEIGELLAPYRGRKFFVFHPAWGAFADEYGLVQVAVERGHKEPSPGMLAELIIEAKESGAKVVFVQPQFPRRSAEMVAEEVGARVMEADPLARDWLTNTREVSRKLAGALAP